jgi:hypothetical protein
VSDKEEPTSEDLLNLLHAVFDQISRERDLFLALVDERERMMGIDPRTAEIRKWYRKIEHS